MSSINRWVLRDDSNGVDPTGMSDKLDSSTMLRKVSSHAARGSQGGMACNLALALNPVAALATITCSGNGTNNATLTVGNVVITLKTSGAVGSSNQINLGSAGDGTDVASYIAALINGTTLTAGFSGSSTSFAGICTASVTGAVITLTAAIPGTIGNGLALTKSEATIALTHLWGAATAGTEGTAKTFSLGL